MRRRRKQQGVVLIIAITILAAIVAILASYTATQSVSFQATSNRIGQRRARLMAEAAIQRALATLQTQTTNVISQQDDWYALGTGGADKFLVGNDSFRMQIIDATSLLNINTATQQQLMNLPLTQEMIDSLLDFRTAGENARPDGGKDPYYNNLPNPYNAKLRRLDTLDELLQIKGFDVSTIYNPPGQQNSGASPLNNSSQVVSSIYQLCTTDSFTPNTTAAGARKANINRSNANAIARRGIPMPIAQAIVARRNGQGTFRSMGDVLRSPGVTAQIAGTLLDNFSISTNATIEGLINVNTASQEVLSTIPNLPPDVVDTIVQRQGQGINSMTELAGIPGVTLQVLQQVADSITVGSQNFIVRVLGHSGAQSDSTASDVALEAIITVSNNSAKVTKIYETPYKDAVSQWNWDASSNNEIDLGSATP